MTKEVAPPAALEAADPVAQNCVAAGQALTDAVELAAAGRLVDAWTSTVAAAKQCWSSIATLLERFLPVLG